MRGILSVMNNFCKSETLEALCTNGLELVIYRIYLRCVSSNDIQLKEKSCWIERLHNKQTKIENLISNLREIMKNILR